MTRCERDDVRREANVCRNNREVDAISDLWQDPGPSINTKGSLIANASRPSFDSWVTQDYAIVRAPKLVIISPNEARSRAFRHYYPYDMQIARYTRRVALKCIMRRLRECPAVLSAKRRVAA